MQDTYRTLESGGRVEMKVVDSRFIGEALPVASKRAAEDAIAAIRIREPKATHHCTAYRLGARGDTFRYDDDGEPSGTAGPPILRQIDAEELTNTLVVVTRYYGGTKLGTGGLMRAYGDAASEALDAASIIERILRVPVRLRFAYDDTAPAEHVLRQFDTTIARQDYTEVTELTVRVRRSEKDAFEAAFTNALGGRGEILPEEERG